jgi:NADPH2 dehydrogenase
VPGLFDNICINGLELENRIMLSPMCQYASDESGKVNMWHKAHYGSRMMSRPGLMILEATAVERRGRISRQDLGIWSDDHIPGLKEIVDFSHQLGVKIGIQLAHAGRKAAPDEHIVSASAITHRDGDNVPHELTTEEIEEVILHFVKAAERSLEAGFDMIEIHGAHGYLINQFLSPFTNHRTDEYGGTQEKRNRFAREIIQRIKKVLGNQMPLFLRVSATEYVNGGLKVEEMKQVCCDLEQFGVDTFDVSSGGNLHHPIQTWPGYQVALASQIKDAVSAPVIAVGKIVNGAMAEEIIRNGRADMVAIGRAYLADPYWAITAARELGIERQLPYS